MIKEIKTEQFAGIQDKKVQFTDGMNILLGKNEAGKSTLLSAMYHALNTPVKIDKRTGKEFIQSSMKDGSADVSLTVNLDGEDMTIKKIWDLDGVETTVSLRDAKGLSRGTKAESKLNEAKKYSPAVYRNLIFGNQKNEADILDWCYSFFGQTPEGAEETRKYIQDALSVAGGISPDKFQALLDEQIKDTIDHWDFEQNRPFARNTRWKTGGSILKAYYAYMDAENELAQAKSIAEELSSMEKKLEVLDQTKEEAEKKKEALQKDAAQVEAKENLASLLTSTKAEYTVLERDLTEWPKLKENYETANQLRTESEEQENRKKKELQEKKEKEKKIVQKTLYEAEKYIEKYKNIEKDSETVKKNLNQIAVLDNMISSGKLVVKGELSSSVCIESYKTKQNFASGEMEADGFVRIELPEGTLEIAPLMKTPVHEMIESKKALENEVKTILDAYECNEEKIWDIRKEYDIKKNEVLFQKHRMETEFSDEDKNEYVIHPEIQVRENLDDEIREFLKQHHKPSIDTAYEILSSRLESFEEKYETPENLAMRVDEAKSRIDEYTQKLDKMKSVGTVAEISKQIKAHDEMIKQTETSIRTLQTEIGVLSAKEFDLSELEEDADTKCKAWEEEKEKYTKLKRIQEDFTRIRNSRSDSFADFYDKFNTYVGMLTDKSVAVHVSDGLTLKTGMNQVTRPDLLSEGTKKTILLAFRLAVLSYFYPNGGGFMVIDDDLLDMDPERRTQAAELLKEFCKNNQVIFATCDPAMCDLLGGNVVKMS